MHGRRLARVALAAALAPCAAGAETDWFAVPSVSVMQLYDDNIFSSATQPEEDRVLQAGPALEAGAHASRLSLRARYAFEDEDYAEHSELDADRARENAGLDYRYDASRLTTWTLNGDYARTNRAGELNPELGLDAGRAGAEAHSVRPGLRHRFDTLTVGTADYTWAREELAGGPGTRTQTAQLGADRDLSRHTMLHANYIYREFLFEEQADVTSHSVMLGATRALTLRTVGTIKGGPRFSEGEVDAEGTVLLSHLLEPGTLSLSYNRGLTSVVGQAGTVATDTVEAAALRPIGRSLELRATAGWASSRRQEFGATVRRLGLEATWRIGNALSIFASSQSTVQRGGLDASGTNVERNIVMVGLTLRGAVGPRTKPTPTGPQPPSTREGPEEDEE